MKLPFRTGFGYDIHAFAENRKLILGGVEIPHDKGLLGHSDADVLLHAITDAVLGAVALGDIGHFFPDNDPKYKNADSRILLKEAYLKVKETSYVIGNVDTTLVLQKPKIAPHLEKIRNSISEILECSVDQISVKATTSEKMGFVGREEGVKAYANVMLINKENL